MIKRHGEITGSDTLTVERDWDRIVEDTKAQISFCEKALMVLDHDDTLYAKYNWMRESYLTYLGDCAQKVRKSHE